METKAGDKVIEEGIRHRTVAELIDEEIAKRREKET